MSRFGISFSILNVHLKIYKKFTWRNNFKVHHNRCPLYGVPGVHNHKCKNVEKNLLEISGHLPNHPGERGYRGAKYLRRPHQRGRAVEIIIVILVTMATMVTMVILIIRSSLWPTGSFISAKRVINHPNYGNHDNDIALLEVCFRVFIMKTSSTSL